MNVAWMTEQCFDTYFQAYGEIPATALINRTAIEIVMQGINAHAQEDFLFDFDSIWDDKANRASQQPTMCKKQIQDDQGFLHTQYRMIML